MNSVVGVLTAIGTGMAIIGGGIRAMAKLTRLVDAVERLSVSGERAVTQLGDHEKRLIRLENH